MFLFLQRPFSLLSLYSLTGENPGNASTNKIPTIIETLLKDIMDDRDILQAGSRIAHFVFILSLLMGKKRKYTNVLEKKFGGAWKYRFAGRNYKEK